MTSFADMRKTVSGTDANAAGYCAANFCGYTYGRLNTVSTAAAVLIFIAHILILKFTG